MKFAIVGVFDICVRTLISYRNCGYYAYQSLILPALINVASANHEEGNVSLLLVLYNLILIRLSLLWNLITDIYKHQKLINTVSTNYSFYFCLYVNHLNTFFFLFLTETLTWICKVNSLSLWFISWLLFVLIIRWGNRASCGKFITGILQCIWQ